MRSTCQNFSRREESTELTLTLEGSELPYEEEGESEEMVQEDSALSRAV